MDGDFLMGKGDEDNGEWGKWLNWEVYTIQELYLVLTVSGT